MNSPGGSTTAGLAIYDNMQFIQPDVSTICLGMAASMGAILLVGGAIGKRYALPNAEVMIHQPWGGTQGQASDIQIRAERILKTKDLLCSIIAERSNQSVEKVSTDFDRDFFMSGEEAVQYGIVDKVIEKKDRS
ncbi:ATP-dependent Clp protease proteolytic subunit [Brevibacillus laterosporus]|nr:ATP-dependent Clp protease proteolytic subunit [Brevibacillus laterosporus]